MPVRAVTRDPRSVVTPDAFEVSPDLLGYPLASPSRRLVAIGIDLLVIALITAMTNSFALVLGIVAAGVFIRAGFKRTPVRGTAFGRAMRFTVGCFGLVVAGITMLLWSIFGIDFEREQPRPEFSVSTGVPEGRIVTGRSVGELLNLAEGGLALERAEDAAVAESALRVLAESGRDLGLTRSQIRTALLEAVPEDRPWSGQAPGMIEAVLDELTGEEAPSPPPEAVTEDLSGLSVEEALEEYRGILTSGEEGAEARRRALRSRLLEDIAADTLRSLERRVADWRDDARRAEERLAEAQRNLEEATSGGILSTLRDFVDELGFGFGWASLYLTIFLSWWQGQTVGKRIVKIRVKRLDGEPINWWVAFERAGGYAAGFATGLLGFAQVYWDSNRQAIHDRIVGTVVVMDGAEKVADWETAL